MQFKSSFYCLKVVTRAFAILSNTPQLSQNTAVAQTCNLNGTQKIWHLFKSVYLIEYGYGGRQNLAPYNLAFAANTAVYIYCLDQGTDFQFTDKYGIKVNQLNVILHDHWTRPPNMRYDKLYTAKFSFHEAATYYNNLSRS